MSKIIRVYEDEHTTLLEYQGRFYPFFTGVLEGDEQSIAGGIAADPSRFAAHDPEYLAKLDLHDTGRFYEFDDRVGDDVQA